jgi:hypothetical protein
MGMDVGYSLYLDFQNRDNYEHWFQESYRLTDRQVWFGEIVPPIYYPTTKNFFLHKPNVRVRSDVYGWFYYSALMRSPTVVNSVLERRTVSFSIDKHGFRETTPIDRARIFALGDSFTFSTLVDQRRSWVKLLEKAVQEPIYNLGLNGTSPKQQLMLLEHILQTKPRAITIRHLLWMIFEGNDLEDDYQSFREAPSNVFRGTIVEAITSVPTQIQKQSIINRLITGELTFTLPSDAAATMAHRKVDGVGLTRALYHSTRFGYRLFFPPYIERARKPRSYVLSHANRKRLDQTFRDMESLSRKHEFAVTVLVAPTAPRLYAAYFEEFPSITDEPYFINYVEDLATSLGFDVINLYRLMLPHAEKRLLHWRDDSHWNDRGEEVVSEIVAKHLQVDRSAK